MGVAGLVLSRVALLLFIHDSIAHNTLLLHLLGYLSLVEQVALVWSSG